MAGTRFSNFVKLQINPIAAGATSIALTTLGDGNKLPDLTRYHAAIIVGDDSEDPEIIKVITQDKGADSLTSIQRGKLGTADINHNTGGKTYFLVIGPLAERVSQVFHASEYGMIADGGVTDNSPLLTEAIADVKALGGGTIKFDKTGTSYYGFTSTVTIDTDNIKIIGDKGIELRLSTASIAFFEILGEFENIEFSDIDIIGVFVDSATTKDTSEAGINIISTGPLNKCKNILIDNVLFKGFGGFGVRMRYCEDIRIINSIFRNIHYAGTGIESCQRGVFAYNLIEFINGSEVENAYGAYFSRLNGTEVDEPRTEGWDILCNIINDIPNWEALDSKGSKNVTMAANVISRCAAGITIAAGRDIGGVPFLAPLNVHITNNNMDSETTDPTRMFGISFTGASQTETAYAELATGSIIGNTITRYGRDNTSNWRSGILAYATKGLLISDNNLYECANSGILLEFHNYGAKIFSNGFTNTNQEAGLQSSICIEIKFKNNNGFIVGNHAHTKDYTPGGSGSVNEIGVWVQNEATVHFYYFSNDFEVCTTRLVAASSTISQIPFELFSTFREGMAVRYTDVNNGNLQLTKSHYYIAVTTSTTASVITLPATHVAGQRYEIRDKGGNLGTNTITIGRNGNLINGSASDLVLGSAYNLSKVIITSNGTGWFTESMKSTLP